ncbi:TIGR03767 family metallophosphoesterase [Phytoactinopolyspora limicola]|uniref:TIGR03767 family metallophosphoesterase n=1 Tax=Phytoactinopolyspora limicola TaxID=2715536 RepID=UPI0014094EFD|nr:TIGR03767 family metallophosphoesterase [Phytoactinopolyspora limicola]
MPHSDSVPSTVDRTIQRGAVQRAGTVQDYRSLSYASGEAHVTREDLARRRSTTPGRSLAYIAHLTDVQLADIQAPARLEVAHGYPDRPGSSRLVPAWRPQELLAAHATDALVRTLNRVQVSPLTGARLDAALTTGDNIDNMQWNEAQAFLRLLSGGPVSMDSGGPTYEGVQDGSVEWAWDPAHPESAWAAAYGFPEVAGLIEAGLRPFTAAGLEIPWLTCHGNHDGLLQGRTRATPELAKIMTGDRKMFALPPGPVADFVTDPLDVFAGQTRLVQPSDERRPIERMEFVRAHFADGGFPRGHGFTEQNLADGTAYYAYDDIPGVRIIVLDTTNPGGHFEGSIDERQLSWLKARLGEVHGGDDERLVLVASHHPRTSMTNDVPVPAGQPDSGRRVLGDELAAVLGTYPNVLAWISGHTHRHHVRAWPGAGGGFWEITTASVMEWPVQLRLLEIVENGDETLSLVCTVVDHSAPLAPGAITTPDDLASWHRELAANSPISVGGADAGGAAVDRNVELVLPDPRGKAGDASAQRLGDADSVQY